MGICDGRTVIITGAARGLGRAYALGFAAEGANVVVNDIGTSLGGEGRDTSAADGVVAEIKAAGGNAIANGGSVTDFAAMQAMVEEARPPSSPAQAAGWAAPMRCTSPARARVSSSTIWRSRRRKRSPTRSRRRAAGRWRLPHR